MGPLLLLDGNSLTYRAFFALPTDMATASGQVTNAVYGFTSMLVNLLRDHQTDQVAVAFDRPEPTFRHQQVPEYKAQRESAPDILRQQMGLVRQVLDALGIPVLDLAGFEADDLIATIATAARDRGDDVLIVTGDRDTYQLVEDPHVKVLYNRRGVSDYALYDEAGIEERTGVTPAQYTEYAALRGDPSDNLAGVPGVGEKTAAKLITTYGGLDGIFASLGDLSPKLRENLAGSEAQVRRNAEVMVLRRDAPIPVDGEALARRPFDLEAVHELFNFLEFRALFDRLADVVGVEANEATVPTAELVAEGLAVTDAHEAEVLLRGLVDRRVSAGPEGGFRTDAVALAPTWEGVPGRSPLTGLAVAAADVDGAESRDPVPWLDARVLADEAVIDALRMLVAGNRAVVAHGAKPLLRALAAVGVDVQALTLDTEVAAYLIDPAQPSYALNRVVDRYLGLRLGDGSSSAAAAADAAGQLALGIDEVVDGDGSAAAVAERATEAAIRAVGVARLAPVIHAALESQGLERLYREIENPLVRVLARMEAIGVGVDVAVLEALQRRLSLEAAALEEQIQDVAGSRFKVNSTPQLRSVLFDQLGLSPHKKTKTGYSTDAASLERLRGQHPVIDLLLRYREVEKLRSTYGESLLAEVAPDGRIRATFNQTVARTGRLSSDAPNLHNIPVRSEEGRQFRGAFVPADGYELLVADYNQIELRVIAHLADDPGLVAAFTAGEDIHTATASRVFGVDPAEVTSAQRAKAKMVSYGLAYGMESYGLAQRLSIPVPEAQAILDAYFVAFPNVRAYMERTVEEARQRGYTETLFGRRRPIPELSSSNHRIRQAGERQAMNAGIQGLAADIFKVALVRIDAALEAASAQSRLILQVHDEVILEVPPTEHDEMAEMVPRLMVGAAELSVPLEVDLAFGPSWASAKG